MRRRWQSRRWHHANKSLHGRHLLLKCGQPPHHLCHRSRSPLNENIRCLNLARAGKLVLASVVNQRERPTELNLCRVPSHLQHSTILHRQNRSHQHKVDHLQATRRHKGQRAQERTGPKKQPQPTRPTDPHSLTPTPTHPKRSPQPIIAPRRESPQQSKAAPRRAGPYEVGSRGRGASVEGYPKTHSPRQDRHPHSRSLWMSGRTLSFAREECREREL
jgi:hypothetical protein